MVRIFQQDPADRILAIRLAICIQVAIYWVGWFACSEAVAGVFHSLKSRKCTTSVRETRSIRNPFNSIHAAALLNQGEATGGLAVMTLVEQEGGLRAIVNKLNIVFHKKARGVITCHSNVSLYGLEFKQPVDVTVISRLLDEAGDQVATVEANWVVSSGQAKKSN